MLKSASFRFHSQLNDFLESKQKNTWIKYQFYVSPSVKNVIEALGVPHPEVSVILVNNEPVDFSYLIKKEDRVDVYPINDKNTFPKAYSLNNHKTPDTFILDVHLGKLAKALRLLGLDTLYENDYADEAIVSIAAKEQRIILTRDLHLLQHNAVKWGYWIRSQYVSEQIKEVVRFFKLAPKFAPFVRCLECNGIIVRVDKESIDNWLQEETRKYFNEFFQCKSCKRIYWKGSHYNRLQEFLHQILQNEL
ncbi:Mut7-C ubiquitin/RNAse domain-containing protein [Solitalea lacus]|uniref:Mut7-C ubiquitin/RNAse domain-containing protein n=1 Tax=Solitalea lacus TaxID=2911172 RepID=UPI001ED9F693|nr:Mut7-C ubiquitin/RNAse domain-containing protein [Solitalea lacus]UKJ09109.1 Mut7-C ubiquitin/RNAse domain-containing protein [Solitalea lacus]